MQPNIYSDRPKPMESIAPMLLGIAETVGKRQAEEAEALKKAEAAKKAEEVKRQAQLADLAKGEPGTYLPVDQQYVAEETKAIQREGGRLAKIGKDLNDITDPEVGAYIDRVNNFRLRANNMRNNYQKFTAYRTQASTAKPETFNEAPDMYDTEYGSKYAALQPQDRAAYQFNAPTAFEPVMGVKDYETIVTNLVPKTPWAGLDAHGHKYTQQDKERYITELYNTDPKVRKYAEKYKLPNETGLDYAKRIGYGFLKDETHYSDGYGQPKPYALRTINQSQPIANDAKYHLPVVSTADVPNIPVTNAIANIKTQAANGAVGDEPYFIRRVGGSGNDANRMDVTDSRGFLNLFGDKDVKGAITSVQFIPAGAIQGAVEGVKGGATNLASTKSIFHDPRSALAQAELINQGKHYGYNDNPNADGYVSARITVGSPNTGGESVYDITIPANTFPEISKSMKTVIPIKQAKAPEVQPPSTTPQTTTPAAAPTVSKSASGKTVYSGFITPPKQ